MPSNEVWLLDIENGQLMSDILEANIERKLQDMLFRMNNILCQVLTNLAKIYECTEAVWKYKVVCSF